jgi:hypothetical protein
MMTNHRCTVIFSLVQKQEHRFAESKVLMVHVGDGPCR